MKQLEEGDLAVALPSKSHEGEPAEYVLILNKEEDFAECVLVTRRLDLAIQRDLILGYDETGIDGDIVIHTLTSSRIPVSRISTVIGHCSDEVLQEVIDTRYSYPSGRYRSGKRLLPIGDHRERQLKAIYLTFEERFDEPVLTTIIEETQSTTNQEAEVEQSETVLLEHLISLLESSPNIAENPNFSDVLDRMLLMKESHNMRLERAMQSPDADLLLKIGCGRSIKSISVESKLAVKAD